MRSLEGVSGHDVIGGLIDGAGVPVSVHVDGIPTAYRPPESKEGRRISQVSDVCRSGRLA